MSDCLSFSWGCRMVILKSIIFFLFLDAVFLQRHITSYLFGYSSQRKDRINAWCFFLISFQDVLVLGHPLKVIKFFFVSFPFINSWIQVYWVYLNPLQLIFFLLKLKLTHHWSIEGFQKSSFDVSLIVIDSFLTIWCDKIFQAHLV